MKKAIFLDRDGTINIDYGYTYKIDEFVLIDEKIPQILKRFQKKFLLILVTNQSGIDRGYFTEEDFWNFVHHMEKMMDIKFDGIYFAPNHPDFSGESSLRKPDNGMLLQAQKDFYIDLENSFMIGDSHSDVMAGKKTGCKTIFFGEKTCQEADFSVRKWEEIEKIIL